MNDNFGRRRGPRQPWPRLAGFLAAMACIALLAAACSGGSSSSSTPGGSTTHDKALAYAQCMRSHGMANFPDPNSNGDFRLQVGADAHGSSGQRQGGVDQNSPQYATANRACEKLLSSGPKMSGTQQQQALSQLVKYAECMRAHGVPNFPDPTAVGGGMGFNTSGVDFHSPQFQSAQQACQSLQSKAKGQSPAGSGS